MCGFATRSGVLFLLGHFNNHKFMSSDKKRSRSGFLGIKLSKEALSRQLENYKSLGLSSSRAKASIAYVILSSFSWASFIGQNQDIDRSIGNSIFLVILIIGVLIYKAPKIGIISAFSIFLVSALLSIIYNPATILGLLIGFYILAYFIYPAYQVEKAKK